MGRTHCVCSVGMRVPQYGRSDVAPLLFRRDYEKIKGNIPGNIKSRILRKISSRKRKVVRELEAMHIRTETILPVMKQLLDVLSEIVKFKKRFKASHH